MFFLNTPIFFPKFIISIFQMKIKFKNIDISIFFIFFIFYISILIGFFFNEVSLGGAKSVFNHYYKISLSFAENFLTTFREFDTEEAKIVTRNSPIFWIILSQVSKFISYDFLRVINSVVSIFICYYFFKCLKFRYKKIEDYGGNIQPPFFCLF